MELSEFLFGRDCICGKHHQCSIQKVWIAENALSCLSEFCRNYAHILLVADENTYAAAGEKTAALLTDKISEKVIFSGKTLLIPDEKAIIHIQDKLPGCDLILGVGSGVIQDLCKYVSHFSGIPYVIAATAPSMDGYASTGAAMILHGMKETVPAGLPLAIAADISVLKEAPMQMIRSGFGDIIGKYSALCDWELSRIVNNEYFCPYIYDTTLAMVEKVRALASGLQQRNPESIRALTEALIAVGIMMSFAGSSRPASGSEHHLSHFFEITGILRNEPYFCHGIDVAYSTVITARIREQLLSMPFPDRYFRPEKNVLEAKIQKIYGNCADGCLTLQQKVGNYSKTKAERTDIYRQKEQEIKAMFRRYPDSAEILSILAESGLNMKEFYELYGMEKIRTAVSYAKDLKDRYTVLWLYYDLYTDDTKGLSL